MKLLFPIGIIVTFFIASFIMAFQGEWKLCGIYFLSGLINILFIL